MIVDADTLEAALKPLQKVAGGASTLQVLNNVLLIPDDGALKCVATDLDTTVTTRCVVDGDPIRACLSGSQLYQLARGITGPLEIEIEENWWAEITADETTARVVGVRPDDYPEYDEPTEAEWQTVTGDELARLVDATLHAVSDDDARANLTGAHVEVAVTDSGAEHLAATSTDGHRLARLVSRQPFDRGALPEEGVIIPKQAWSMMGGLGRDSENVKLAYKEGHVYARGAGQLVGTREIEGTFPDFEQVLPNPSEDVAHFDKQELADAIDFISMFASNKTSNIRLTFDDGELELYASDPDVGESSTTVPCDYDPDEEIKCGFNFKYIQDALKTTEGDEVMLDPIDTLSPMKVAPADDNGQWQCAMPMRI